MCKLFAGDTAVYVADRAVQIAGGYGYTTDFPAERFLPRCERSPRSTRARRRCSAWSLPRADGQRQGVASKAHKRCCHGAFCGKIDSASRHGENHAAYCCGSCAFTAC